MEALFGANATGLSFDVPLPQWYATDWVRWGIVPFVAANVGFWPTVLVLELVIRAGCAKPIECGYHAGSDNFTPIGRADALATVRAKIPFVAQLRNSAFNMIGPMALLNVVILGFLMPLIIAVPPEADTVFTVSPLTVVQFGLLFLVGDFGLYWGHRVQHMYGVLWTRLHSFHHQVGTPSPVSTVYIDGTDATLQAGLPMLFAAVVVSPHPLLFALYVGARVSENAVNHCGLDNFFLDLITLKVLPGRASVGHHDAHHQFSNYGPHAKNFAEAFWVWDWAFGTLSKTATAMRKKGQ